MMTSDRVAEVSPPRTFDSFLDDNEGRERAAKWAAVRLALGRPEIARLSDRAIAPLCRVSQPFVGKVRRRLRREADERARQQEPPIAETVAPQQAQHGDVEKSSDPRGGSQHVPTCHDIDPNWRQRIPAGASFPYSDPSWTQPLLPRYSIDEPGTVDCDWDPFT